VGFLEGPGHRHKGRVVKDDVGAAAGLPALLHVPDVALEEAEGGVATGRMPASLLEVRLPPGEEVVEDDNALPQSEEGVGEVGADETGAAGHDPPQRRRGKTPAKLFVPGHGSPPLKSLPGGILFETDI